MDEKIEPFYGQYDWDEAFRQNPLSDLYVPDWVKEFDHGCDTAADAMAWALAHYEPPLSGEPGQDEARALADCRK